MPLSSADIAASISRQINQRIGVDAVSGKTMQIRALEILGALIGEIELTMNALREKTF